MATPASKAAGTGDFLTLVDFVMNAGDHSEGFADIERDGRISNPTFRSTLTNSRMTFFMASAYLTGIDQVRPAVEAGVNCLLDTLRDVKYGGFFDSNANTLNAERKLAYNHVFVLLAGASALGAGHEDGRDLAVEALDIIERHFWNEELGILRDEYDRSFQVCSPYYGCNSNMHAVEAFLSASQELGRPDLIVRAERIAEFFINKNARQHDWMLPEHFDFKGEPDLGYNRDPQEDVFKPYGVTIGHLFEWARLLLELELGSKNKAPWRIEAAIELYRKAKQIGWEADGKPGFVYTVDFLGEPISTKRLHWVVCEAIACAATFQKWKLLGDQPESDFRIWNAHLREVFYDSAVGGWHHELDSEGNYSAELFAGKPDAYHLAQAFLLSNFDKGTGLIRSIQASTGRR